MTTVIPWVPRYLAGLPSSVPLSESFFFFFNINFIYLFLAALGLLLLRTGLL